MSDESSFGRLGLISARGVATPSRTSNLLPVQNPATGEFIAEIHEASADEVDDVVEQAHDVFETVWRDIEPDRRGRMLAAWADAIVDRIDDFTGLEVTDVGHLRREARGDLDSCVRSLRYFAGMADKLEGDTYARLPDRLAYGVDEPFGVVAGISPYNGNANFVVNKAAPALVAGNCIVLKAPEIAPLLNYRLVELALDAGIPPGVVNMVSGRGHVVGPLLTEHPGVGMVSLTGGVVAGRAVVSQSAHNLIPVTLELGGKSPAILLPDADLRIAVPSVLHSNFAKSGQSCVAGSRILVHESMYEHVCDELARRAAQVRVGLPTLDSSQMGTLISRQHRSRVHDAVQQAVAGGATCLVGGAPADGDELARGAFYEPTVLADVDDANPAATTEFFGPVASVLSYTDLDHALARANATDFGLSAQVWGNDARAIQYLADRLVAGTVWVNTYRSFHPTTPFGGYKQSGFGKEAGFAAVAMYTRRKSVIWDLSTAPDVPYREELGARVEK